MPQFFIEKELSEGAEVEIRGSDAHHIASVLRLEEGDWLVLSDGSGSSFRSRILECRPRSIRAFIEERLARREGPPPPVLAIASIRSERLEWAIQKCVELGCVKVIPFDSARTVRRSSGKTSTRKHDRFQRIAVEAAKQSGLPVTPVVETPIEFDRLCSRLSEFDPSIMLYEGESAMDLKSVWRNIAPSAGSPKSESLIIIGPEGGFTPEEVESASRAGAITATIGSQILRVETAAIAAMAICQYELGNMDSNA